MTWYFLGFSTYINCNTHLNINMHSCFIQSWKSHKQQVFLTSDCIFCPSWKHLIWNCVRGLQLTAIRHAWIEQRKWRYSHHIIFFNFIKSFQTAGVSSWAQRIVDRGFLQMGVGFSLKDRVRSSGLRVELLLHCIKRSQLTRMSTRNWDILSMSYQEDSPRPGNASVFPLGELKEVARGTQRRFGLLC